MQKEAVKRAVLEAWRCVSERDEGAVAGRNAIAAARLETARLGRLLQPLARSARRAVRQDKAEWLKRRSARIRGGGGYRFLSYALASCQTAQRFQESEGTETSVGHCSRRRDSFVDRDRDCGSVGSVFTQRDLASRLRELRIPWQAQFRPEEWPDEDPWDGCETERPWERSRISPGICEAGSAVTPGRGARADGAQVAWFQCPEKPRVPLSAKNARGVLLASHTGKIYSRIVWPKIQHLLPEAAQGRQSGGIKGGSMSVPQIVLSFFIEKMRKQRKCAAVLFTDYKGAFHGGLGGDCVGWSVATRHEGAAFRRAGLSGQNRQALRDLLAKDAVVLAQGLEPVCRRAAQDWHIGCSFW